MPNPNNHPFTVRFHICGNNNENTENTIDGYGQTPRKAANAALFIARQITVPKNGKVRCSVLEHGTESLWAYGPTADEAADQVCRMHQKATKGGGR